MGSRSVHMYWAFDIASFSQAISAARMAANMKQADLANLIGMAASNLSRIERGENANPEINTILAICDALDLDPRQYFEVRKLGE